MSHTYVLKSLFTVILFAGVIFPAGAYYKSEPNEYECAGVQGNISNIDDRLRAGYKVRTGERLKERLRHLKKLRYACKKAGFKTNY